MRALIELLHIAIGLAAAAVIAWLCAWAYPRARDDIWLVAWIAMAAVVVMGIRPLHAARLADRAARQGETGSDG